MKIIIVGAGEVGFHLAKWLSREDKDIVVIDQAPEALQRVQEQLDVQTIRGAGSHPQVLLEAGVQKADVLLAVTDRDEVNLVCCLFADLLSGGLPKVALVRQEEYAPHREALIRRLNITNIINPDRELIKAILRILSAPEMEEVNDFVGGSIKMIGGVLPAASPLCGRIQDLPLVIERKHLIIAALVRQDRLIIPKGKDTLQAGDLVYFVCRDKDLDFALKLFNQRPAPLKSLMIMGGGRIGGELARELEIRRYRVKLIESNPERCKQLSGLLRRTLVLQGSATDQELLMQENIGGMDMVLALTGDDETNILSCLLAHSLGARKILARIDKLDYMDLSKMIELDFLVSPRLSAINSIFPYIRRGKVVSSVAIKGQEAEVMEAVAQEGTALVGTPLKSLKFPREALLLCIMRGEEVVIPSGDDVIQPDDRVIILARKASIPQVEKALSGPGR
ncbi:MAG: Trk system potassium transporter TrkA [Desulfobaccales bacterium]